MELVNEYEFGLEGLPSFAPDRLDKSHDLLMNHLVGRYKEVSEHSDLGPGTLGVGIGYHERLLVIVVVHVSPEDDLHHFINGVIWRTLTGDAPN